MVDAGYSERQTMDYLLSRADPFNPGAVAGIFDLAWCEARFDTTTATGSTVQTMIDQSSARSNWTQSTAGFRPTMRRLGSSGFPTPNGLPYLEFDGTADFYSRAANLTDAKIFVMMVARKRAASSGYMTLLRADTVQLLARTSGADQWGAYTNADTTTGEAMGTTWRVFTWIYRAATDIDMGGNGLLVNFAGSSDVASSGSTELCSSAGGQCSNVDIAAWGIGSDATVSYENIARAHNYFRTVYGIP